MDADDALLQSFLKPAAPGAPVPVAPTSAPTVAAAPVPPAGPQAVDDDDKLLGAFLHAAPAASVTRTAAATPSTQAAAAASDDPLGALRRYIKPQVGPSASEPDWTASYTAEPATWDDTKKAIGKAIDLNEKTADGLTFGFAPRLGALADSDPIGKALGINPNAPSYTDALADRNATDKRIAAEMPIASKVAETGGAVLGSAIPGGIAANLARGFGLSGRVLAGVGTGAAIGGAQGAAESEDLGDLSQTARLAASGAETGAEFGGALPIAGQTFGAAYRALPTFVSPPAGLNRTAALLLSGSANPETSERLASLGPYGMLADASPSTLGLTQGVAAKAGPGADLVVNALTSRAAGQSDRLLTSLDDNLGPAFSPRQAATMMTDRQAATSPMYQQALRSAPPVDISPVVQQLENARLFAKGTDAQRLDRFGTLLQGPQRINGVAQPEFDATALHRAKMEMDAQIEGTNNQTGSAAATATRDMVGVRSALNHALEDQVPGYGDANLAYATAARGQEAFDAGRQVLKPGANMLWPQDLDHQFADLPLDQQAMMRAGARSDIEAGLGSNRNDLVALNKVVGGENDFNRPKMMTLFGPDQTGNVVRDVNNERTFANTYNKVVDNSQSAQRLSNSAALDAADQPVAPIFPKSASIPGLLTHTGEYLVRKGYGALAQASGENTREALAHMLISGAPSAVPTLAELQAGLASRGNVAASISDTLAHRAAIAAALTGYRQATR